MHIKKVGKNMMKCSEYFGIQFAQSQLSLCIESMLTDVLVQRVFASRDDISVIYDGWKKPAKDMMQVKNLFNEMGKTYEQTGRIERIDMPASMKINIHEDGISADAQWITMSAISNEIDDSTEKIEYMTGLYNNTYVKEEQLWKIKDICWKKLYCCGQWNLPKGSVMHPDYKRWITYVPMPLPVDDASASLQSLENIKIRNQMFAFAHLYLREGVDAIDHIGFFSENAKIQARKALEVYVKDIPPILMLSSPIVEFTSEENATAFFNTGLFLPDNKGYVYYHKGRTILDFHKEKQCWIADNYQWMRYATLDAWNLYKE